MKILVYDVAAESGGVLTILKGVYEQAKNLYKDIEWKFVLSLPKLEECSNITVDNYPAVKKSWLSRLHFDKFIAPKIIDKFAPDVVLNLQNITIKTKCKQIIYMQQPLPFIEYKFKLKDKKMWIYQNIIGRMIKKSCKIADKILVQTNWVKDAIVRDCKVDVAKIEVLTPKVNAAMIQQYRVERKRIFFYPAAESVYKNHDVIIKACKILTDMSIDYEVSFTLNGEENERIHSLKLFCELKKLNIKWLGMLPFEQMFEIYAHSILLFPSYIETFGLPLLEARESNCPIIVADTEFAHEVLDGYCNAKYFDKDDAKTLAVLMRECE